VSVTALKNVPEIVRLLNAQAGLTLANTNNAMAVNLRMQAFIGENAC